MFYSTGPCCALTTNGLYYTPMEKHSSPRGEWFSVFSSKKNYLRLVKIIKIILNKLIINNKIVSRHFSMEEKISGVTF
jgi:hypothetical protein